MTKEARQLEKWRPKTKLEKWVKKEVLKNLHGEYLAILIVLDDFFNPNKRLSYGYRNVYALVNTEFYDFFKEDIENLLAENHLPYKDSDIDKAMSAIYLILIKLYGKLCPLK